MEPTRLILVPQLPVKMRYQEWWATEALVHLAPHFDEVQVLGATTSYNPENYTAFSTSRMAVLREADQVRQYMELDLTDRDVLLHMDLSYPGIFHSVLAHKRPARSMVFCHATAQNRLDLFASIRKEKYSMEWGASELYDRVLVATHYHAKKLAKLNMPTVVMGALPHPPTRIYLDTVADLTGAKRTIRMVRTARTTPQKVWHEVEDHLSLLGAEVVRASAKSWKGYYGVLRQSTFLVVTSREETYGYQVVDAVLQGCIPIAPRAYSYPELLPSRLLYDQSKRPKEQAQEIIRIAEAEERNPQPVTLICEREAQNFWNRLAKELKS